MALACNIRIISSVAEAAMLGERTLRGDDRSITVTMARTAAAKSGHLLEQTPEQLTRVPALPIDEQQGE